MRTMWIRTLIARPTAPLLIALVIGAVAWGAVTVTQQRTTDAGKPGVFVVCGDGNAITDGKGQSADNNGKVVHRIDGQFEVGTAPQFGGNAHRIKLCAGFWVTIQISDSSSSSPFAGPGPTIGGLPEADCAVWDGSTVVCGFTLGTEKLTYIATSWDGTDTDRITLLPILGAP